MILTYINNIMDSKIEGSIVVNFVNIDGTLAGTQNGLIMSYYDQTIVFTPFDINKNHFSHLTNAYCIINDKVVKMDNSRYSYPFLLRVWTIIYNGINPVSELTILQPKKNHIIDGNKIDMIKDIDINFWNAILPPILAHQIPNTVPIGSISYYNNKVTGMVVTHTPYIILLNTFTLKLIASGIDYNYANLYYGLSIHTHFYVKQDWDQYEDGFQIDDIIISVEGIEINTEMHYERLSRKLYIDTWFTYMFMERSELSFKIIRKNKELTVKILRKPLYEIMQIPYYSKDDTKISFEALQIYKNECNIKFKYELLKNPKLLFG